MRSEISTETISSTAIRDRANDRRLIALGWLPSHNPPPPTLIVGGGERQRAAHSRCQPTISLVRQRAFRSATHRDHQREPSINNLSQLSRKRLLGRWGRLNRR